MADYFIGEIRAFAFNFPPQDWAVCDGSVVSFMQNQALAAVIGITFGGDGRNTVGLPDLVGRAAIGYGTGTDSSGTQHTVGWGKQDGTAGVTLSSVEMPQHTHQMNAYTVSSSTTMIPAPSVIAELSRPMVGTAGYWQYTSSTALPNAIMSAGVIGLLSGTTNAAHENRQPTLAMNMCIALNGTFPIRA